jgi:protein-serine/threonine kinase
MTLFLPLILSVAGPADFERIRLIGQGDVGKVYLVRLKGSKHLFAMKVLSKQEMIARNKVSPLPGYSVLHA